MTAPFRPPSTYLPILDEAYFLSILARGRAALLVIDVQSGYSYPGKDDYLAKLDGGLQRFRGKIPILHLATGYPGYQNIFTPSFVREYDIQDFLRQSPLAPSSPFDYKIPTTDYVMLKDRKSALVGRSQIDLRKSTTPVEFLKDNGWDVLFLVGGDAKECVLLTALDAKDSGFSLIFLPELIRLYSVGMAGDEALHHRYLSGLYRDLGICMNLEKAYGILETMPFTAQGRVMQPAAKVVAL